MIISLGYMKNGFDAYGDEKIVRKEDFAHWMDREERFDPQGVEFGLDEEIEEVEAGFFELLPTISAIWIKNPNCNLHMNKKTAELFQRNRVILRGVYGSSAERYARKYHLRFLHLDVQLVSTGDYFEHGNDTVTIRFRKDGSVYIHQDCRVQGISASSMGGGEISFDIPDDFYKSMKPEELAEKCWHPSMILSNGILTDFMKKARRKKGYFLDFTDKLNSEEKQ